MAKYQLRNFKDLVDKVCENLKIQVSDTESRRRIKRNLNAVYLDEVVPYKRWPWLRGSRTLQTEPYFGLGTASVIQNSVTVTLTQSPPTSRRGHFFCVLGGAENYRIASHIAGSNVITLETPYSDPTVTTASYRIWTDAIPLPSEAKEVVELTHQHLDRPLQNQGLMEFRRLVANAPHAEGRPKFYTTTGYRDPDPFQSITSFPASVSRSSNGLIRTIVFASNVDGLIAPGAAVQVSSTANYAYNVEAIVSSVSGTTLTYTAPVAFQEATTADATFTVTRADQGSYEDYRAILVYPSVSDKRTTLHVDYQRNVEAMENDGDEPLMPVEDRIVLYYGAMWMSCDRERNPEWGQENFQLMQAKLLRMAGKTEDSPDKPILKPSSLYMTGKRYGQRYRDTTGSFNGVGGSGSGSTTPTGTANSVATFDSNGNLIGSATINLTALEYLLGAQGGTSAAIASGVTGGLIGQWDATTYKAAFINYHLKRGAAYESGTITINSDGSAATIETTFTGASGSGVSFDAAVVAGKIQLTYSASVGSPGTFSYRTLLL